MVFLFFPWNKIFFALLSLLSLSHLVYCSVSINSQAYIKTLCKGKTNEKKIAITFDDGPDSKITPKVLELLDQFNVKATFFCIGKNIENNKDLLNLIDNRGHLIGNHTWSHNRWFDLFSTKKMKADIEKTSGLIFEIINKKIKLFRPPYGVTNPNLKRAIIGLNFKTIGWSVRSFDTVSNSNKTLNRVKRKISNGDIVLFHDNREHIVEILKVFLEYTKNEAYEIVPLDQLLNIKAYE
jgi:peptidoglycan/xylan/chitin deacetylase (PgdA/CDA1 family)